MSRSAFRACRVAAVTVAMCGLFAEVAVSQKHEVHERLRTKGPVRNAGIYHVGLGTWTRARALETQLGPTFRTIYNNTCSSPFFGTIYPNETWTDEGRLPGVNSPDKLYDQNQTSVAAFVGANNQCPEGPTSAPGSARGTAAVGGSYSVDAFAIGYCSDLPGALSVPAGAGANIEIEFRATTTIGSARCAQSPLLAPAPSASFSLVSFPGRGSSAFSCWLVALDLTGVSASFSMRADGTGDYNSSPQTTNTELNHCFSWSFRFPGIASPTSTAASGMILAGAPADAVHLGWLTANTAGGGVTAACSEYDGTVWDHQDVNAAPVYATDGVVSNANGAEGALATLALDAGEAGTGMTTQDSIRFDVSPATSVNGCYFFGGPGGTNVFSSCHIELFTRAATNVTPVSPGSGFCFGDNCAFTCPCAAPNTVPDPSGGHESGCANSNPLALSGVLGATLSTTGVSSVGSSDTLRFFSTTATAGFAFLVKGNASTSNGVFPATADGIRCVSGALVRFGGHNAGTNGDAPGSWSYPNTAQTTSVSVATAQAIGEDASYQLFYRNPAAGWCNGATTNFSCGRRCHWVVGGVDVDLDIWRGQGGTQVPEADEETIGSVTVANLNDTDGDGTLDVNDNSVKKPANSNVGRDEVDLMQLVVRRPNPDLGGIVGINVVSGNVKLWDSSKKETEFTAAGFATNALPRTLWVEARGVSTAVRDIKIEIVYGGVKDAVKATGVWSYNSLGSPWRVRKEASGLPDNPTAGAPDLPDLNTQVLIDGINEDQALDGSRYGIGTMRKAVTSDTLIGGRILFQFELQPAGAEALGVTLDVTRQRKTRERVLAINSGTLATPQTAPDVNFPEEDAQNNESPNDDSTATDRDNVPSNGHIYSFDSPSVNIVAANAFLVRRDHFREWVRVKLDGGFTNQNGLVEGSRASNKQDWHLLNYLVSNASSEWVHDTAATSASSPFHFGVGNGTISVALAAQAITEGFTVVYDLAAQKWTLTGTSGDSASDTKAGAIPQGTEWSVTIANKLTVKLTQGATAFAQGDHYNFSVFKTSALGGKKNEIDVGSIDVTTGP